MSVQLHLGDALEIMKSIPDKSINLVIADPPYNIGKADWDNIDNYITWCGLWIAECQRVLKDNGSFYFFHNDMEQIADLMLWIRNNTQFVFKQLIIWNKRFEGSKNKGYFDGYVSINGLRNYKKMAEYILFYTFQDETGLSTVKLDVNNFTSLREYFRKYQEAMGLSKAEIINRIGQKADHCFRWKSTQWDMPTPETYDNLSKIPTNHGFVRREYEDLRQEYESLRQEYESLRQQYESLRYTFNNQRTHHSVWNYEIAERGDHITPKPVDLVENIITHSSNEGDTILDPFMGSGTTGVACIHTDRTFIGIEIDQNYFAIAKKRIGEAQERFESEKYSER